ncbi:MAG: hypothetical protein R3F21_03770 [Myxococcota bacterium]
MKVDRNLASMEVERAEGGAVVLETLWQDGPVVLAWLRHFG